MRSLIVLVKMVISIFGKINAKKTKRFYLIQKIIPRKSYGHFEIVIELKKFTISSFK